MPMSEDTKALFKGFPPTGAKHNVTPTSLILEDNGTFSFYYSDALIDEEQSAMDAYAEDFVNNEGSGEEISLSIIVNLPALVSNLIDGDYCHRIPGGKFKANVTERAALESLRKQLQDSIDILDRVVYE